MIRLGRGHVWRAITAGLLAGAASCGGTTKRTTLDAHDPRRGELVLETVAETREGAALKVAEGDTLRTGDKLWFRIRTEGPVYVYVIQIFPDGSADLLYPEQGAVLLSAGEEQRVPSDPRQHFVLDETPGLEHVLLIASRERLGEADALLATLVQVIKHQRKWPSGIPLADVDPATPVAVNPIGDEAETEAGPGPEPDVQTDPPAIGASRRRPRPRPAARHGGHGPGPMALPASAKPEGFLNLLGPNRSLERGLRLGTDPARLQVVPDEAGIAVSLFSFHHEP